MACFILHIGTHKTGSTSIQRFLRDNGDYLKANNLVFLRGLDGKPNFKDLFHASCRSERLQVMELRRPKLKNRLFQHWRLKRHLQAAAKLAGEKSVVLSTELLSLLREPGEITRLSALFPGGSVFKVVVVFREKQAFLASMQRQITAQGKQESDLQGHSCYIKSDSWLADNDGIISAFKHLTPDVTSIDYDASLVADGNIVVSFMRALDVKQLPSPATMPFLNRRSFDQPTAHEVPLPIAKLVSTDSQHALRVALSGRKDHRETVAVATRVSRLLGTENFSRVVDVGCGDATLLKLMPEGIFRTGVMPEGEAVAELARLYPSISFVQGLAQRIPLADNDVDLCIVHGVMPVLHGDGILNNCLREFARVTMPGGRLWLGDVVSELNGEFRVFGSVQLGLLKALLKSGEFRAMRHCKKEILRLEHADNAFPAEHVKSEAQSAGFELIDQWPSIRFFKGRSFIAPVRRDFLFRRTS